MVYGISSALVALTIATAITMPGGALYSYVWRVTVPFVTASIIAMLAMMARPHARADREGLTVVNLVRSERFQWAEIIAVRFAKDAPWASLDIADGRNVPLMAIQNSDGAYARSEARDLADLVADRGGT
jgi:hypothetical protein